MSPGAALVAELVAGMHPRCRYAEAGDSGHGPLGVLLLRPGDELAPHESKVPLGGYAVVLDGQSPPPPAWLQERRLGGCTVFRRTESPPRVVIVTTYEGSPWLEECLWHLEGCPYPLWLCLNTAEDNGRDPAGIYLARDLGVPEFVLLHDSCFVKDIVVLDLLFAFKGHCAVSPGFQMLQGKYVTRQLPPLPDAPRTKREAVQFELGYGPSIAPKTVLFPRFADGNRFEEKNGRENMVLENRFLIKYKGHWSMEMVDD